MPADELPPMPIDEQPVIAIKNSATRMVLRMDFFVNLNDAEVILRFDTNPTSFILKAMLQASQLRVHNDQIAPGFA